MATAAVLTALVTPQEYLRTGYHPDVDYVDGCLEDRHVGENKHADLQSELLTVLRSHGQLWGMYAFGVQRVQLSATRYRVPDLCVMPRTWKKFPIVREAPILCIEVLSPEDTFSRTQKKCRDYLSMGVPDVWIFDPDERLVHRMTSGTGMDEIRNDRLTLAGTPIDISVQALFAAMDEGR